MTEQHRKLFREVALKQHTSPEQLDQLIQVTSAREWLLILAILLGISAILCWYWIGTSTIEVTGVTVFVTGKNLEKINTAVSTQTLKTKLSWLKTLNQIEETQRNEFIQEHRHHLVKQLDHLTRQTLSPSNTSEKNTQQHELENAQALLLQIILSETLSSVQIQLEIQTLQQHIAALKQLENEPIALIFVSASEANTIPLGAKVFISTNQTNTSLRGCVTAISKSPVNKTELMRWLSDEYQVDALLKKGAVFVAQVQMLEEKMC